MADETLTKAQSLRVIGQQLAGLGSTSFEVEKSGDDYIVQMHLGKPTGKSEDNALLNRGFQNYRASHDSGPQSPSSIRLHPAQILEADNENRSRRHQATAMPDPYKLSTLLRVLGDYLDRKGADEFAIAIDSASLTVKYGQKSE